MKRAILVAAAITAICTVVRPSDLRAGGHGFGGFGGAHGFGGGSWGHGGGRGYSNFGGGGRQYAPRNQSYWGGHNQPYSNHSGNSYGNQQTHQVSTANSATNGHYAGNVANKLSSTTKTVKYNSAKVNPLAEKKPSNSIAGKQKPGGHHPVGKGRGKAILNGIVDALGGGADSGDAGADDAGSGGGDGYQTVSDSPTDPQMPEVTTASYQPESPDSTTSAIRPAPNALPNGASAEAVKVINPSETGVTVNYTFGSEASSLEAGNANIHSQVSQEIVFDRGGSFGIARYTLGPGTYRFVASESGWDLRTVRE